MQGLSLIHAGFLVAGLAAVLPIVIHLLFRQRTRTVPIGSVRFLQQVVREHRRRRRIRQWLLLSLRVLAMLLLALLFSRPYWDRSQQRGLQEEVVLLLDRSASMQARNFRGESSFERALAAARNELMRLDENVIVHIGAYDVAGVQPVSVENLLETTPSQAAADFGLALSWARDILAASNRTARRIVLVSDFQRVGLSRTPLERLPDGIDLVLHDIGDPLLRNVAIESADAVRTEIRPDRQVAVRAVLRNHGPAAVRKLTVTCEVQKDAKTRFRVERQIDIPGRGNAVVEFPLAIAVDGLYKGRVTLDAEDSLVLDNTRWIALEARHPDRVLLVDGQEGRSVFGNETYFLETALRLRTEELGGRIRSFELDRIVWEAGEGFPRLDGYRAVILANVRSLSQEDGRRMDAYVRGGGNLLIFAGDQVRPRSLAPLQERGLLPGTVSDIPVEGRLRIDQWFAVHPALACFRDPQQGDLRRIEFREILPIQSLTADSTMLLQAGDLILAAERRVGKGRSVYFGSTADRDWTELPRTPMYVPLMRQILAYLTDQLSSQSVVQHQLVSKPGETAGIVAAEPNEPRWTVINVDPRESELDRVSVDEVQKLVGSKPPEDTEEMYASTRFTLPADSLRQDEIWPSLVWLLFFVLATETLLAGRVHA